MERVLALLKDEQRLKVELVSLNLGLGRPETLKRNLERQDQILAEINTLRHSEIMPIMREVAGFVKLAADQRATVAGKR
jgi:hypothetical protein